MRYFRKFLAITTVLMTIGATFSVSAQEFAGLLRDETALALTPTVPNWGMGGAYVAVPDATSMNPAALAFAESGRVTASTGHWNPEAGPNVNSLRLNAVVPVQQMNGSFRFMGEWFGSRGSDTTRVPLGETEFHATTLGLQLGVALTENIGAGVGIYPYEKAEIEYENPATGADVVDAEAMSQLGSIQGGVQWRVLPQLTLGVEGSYIIDELKADIPGGRSEADDYYIRYAAGGICWEPWETTRVALDYRVGEIEGEKTALKPGTKYDQDIDRWSFGIAQEVGMDTTVRVGSKNGGLTLGLGHRFSEALRINYVFVDEAFRDKENAFDTIELHKVALTYSY